MIVAALLFLGLIVLLATGMRVAFAMILSGLVALHFWLPHSALRAIGGVAFSSLNSFLLTAAPLFLFMGEILMRTELSEDLFSAGEIWVGRLPGGLAQVNILVCGVFSTMCGSSVASVAALGTVALPAMKSRGYDQRLSFSSLAAGNTLSILIPPSVPMIIYGGLTGASVGKLFIAGIGPGALLVLMFMVYIAAWNLRVPGLHPKMSEASLTTRQRWLRTIRVIPALLIGVAILVSIFTGFATPTESAAVGAMAALLLSFFYRRLNLKVLQDSAISTVSTVSMMFLIYVGCQFLSYALNYRGVPQQLSELTLSMFHTKWLAIPFIYLVYLILGMFMDGLSMMIITTPIVYPISLGFGFDPIWLGVVMTIAIEMSLITPPVGMNLYILQGLDTGSDFGKMARACVPYVVIMLVVLMLLLAYPSIATLLPNMMMR